MQRSLGLVPFLITRFQLIEFQGLFAFLFEVIASVGGGVVIGLMTFGFFGLRAACIVGGVAFLIANAICITRSSRLPVLLSSMTAYGANLLVCVICSFRSQTHFDFVRINNSVVSFNTPSEQRD